VLEIRYIKPLAKKVAVMLLLKVAVGEGYITFCKDRTKGAGKMCVDTKKRSSRLHWQQIDAYPADEI
jgi:hypothetical protein